MKMQNLLIVGGVELPQVWTYSVTYATIVDSARNSRGVVIGNVIRNDVIKISAGWNSLPASEWSKVLKLFTPSYNGRFQNDVTFYNETTMQFETRLMYVSDRTSSGVRLLDDNGMPIIILEPKLSLIEV